MSTLYLFSDTNLLLQCRTLEELDWSRWSSFDEVRVVVSSPVLKEIDYRKNKGNDRVSSRARAASSLFRAMLESGPKTIKEKDPSVVLCIETGHLPSKTLASRLDYGQRDDQLIGVLHEFISQQIDVDARLLTHDTTPLYTARGVGLVAEIIPDEWLLPPEKSEQEKEMAKLRADLARLKKAEPNFSGRLLDSDQNEVKSYTANYTLFEKLTESEVEYFITRLTDAFPLEADFGPSEPTQREVKSSFPSLPARIEEFVPATEEEIESYREERYPRWVNDCRQLLASLHRKLQQSTAPLTFTFLVQNNGIRPAEDALITITAKGNFRIRPPKNNDENANGNKAAVSQEGANFTLPMPPDAPRGHWKSQKDSFQRLSDSLATFSSYNLFGGGSVFNNNAAGRSLFDSRHELLAQGFPHLPHHDPNAFYYRSGRPSKPQTNFRLECDQWRHGTEEESFSGRIEIGRDAESIEGALECRIQAKNLSDAAVVLVPVRIQISRMKAVLRAEELVASRIKFAGIVGNQRSGGQGPSD
ncbi:MAG: hypothetical protein HYU58_09030 [Proteobacteria bacterium]|nr:hypothetical protein [Pseudomonadota bacterium]